MFLVNGITTHVLFDSGATKSFVSLSLSKKFGGTPGASDYPLEVKIVDDSTMSASRVHQVCIL